MSDNIQPQQLQPGDVLLYHSTGFISDMIRLFDGGAYSHAALFDGQKVVEAIGSGIVGRPVEESVAGAAYVDVYRFVREPGHHHLGEPGFPAQPIVDTAAQFLAKTERYAYEQIVLLAVLACTRRIPVVSDIPFLRWMLRTICDNAAEVINRLVAAGKEPMICSELVYRCYTESGPQYDLIIRGADTLAASAHSCPPLAAAAAPAHEVAVIQAQLDTFLAKYQRAKHRERAALKSNTRPPTGQHASSRATLSESLAALAVADFVTPRDLQNSPDLYKVGTLQA